MVLLYGSESSLFALFLISEYQVVANPAIFVSYNPHFLTAVRLLPYNALPCLFQLDQEKKRTYADLEMEEHGDNYSGKPEKRPVQRLPKKALQNRNLIHTLLFFR